MQYVSAIYLLLFGKVWLGLLQYVEFGKKAECDIYGGQVITKVLFVAVCRIKLINFGKF